MRERHASINDLANSPEQRLFHWPQSRRPDTLPGLSALGLYGMLAALPEIVELC